MQRWGALIIVCAIIAGAVYIVSRPVSEKPSIGEDQHEVQLKSYVNDKYGLQFSYPDSYVLTEQDIGNTSEHDHHAIAIVRAEDVSRVPQNGEGPTAITIDIYGNAIDKQTLEQWIRNSSASNFKLSPNHVLATSTVAGEPAYAYIWNGLYSGDTMVVSNKENILMVTVTYMDSAAVIRDDFSKLLQSVRFR